METITSLLEGPYGAAIKIIGSIVAVFVFSVGLFGFGYYEGHKHATNATAAKILKQVIVQTKYLPGEVKYIHDATATAHDNHDKAKAHVQAKPPAPIVCDVPADTVGVFNANRGTLPTIK